MKRRRKLPKNVTAYVDRHGKERLRYRKTGQTTHHFIAPLGTPEFDLELATCVSAGPQPVAVDRITPGTVSDLVARWYRSADFDGAGDGTKVVMRRIMESFRVRFGADYVAEFTFEHIDAILIAEAVKREGVGANGRARTLGGPEAAGRLRKLLDRLFRHGVRSGMIAVNPVTVAAQVKKPKTAGFHTWTEAEITAFQDRHAMGTKPRLALEIMLWTAQRGGDARMFGARHIDGGRILYRQAKGGKELWLPQAPQLAAAIRAMPSVGLETYLVTAFGKPFTAKGFGQWFRDRCDEAGLRHCTAHGLRKAAARRAAQQGGTNAGLKAVGGWSNDREVALYTAAVEQSDLAEVTLGRVIDWDLANRSERDLANRTEKG